MAHRDYVGMSRAAGAHIGAMDSGDLINKIFDAGLKALYSGDAAAANTLKGVINGPENHIDNIKAVTTRTISDNPDLLKYFSSDFATAIQSKSH